MKKMLGKITRKSGGTAKGDEGEDVLLLETSAKCNGKEKGPESLPALRRRFSLKSVSAPARSLASPTNPNTQSTVSTTPMPWSYAYSDRDCMSPTPTSKVPFQPLATVTSPPAQTSVRRRMSFSLSPSSLRAATQSTAESDDPSPNSRGKVLPNKGSRGEGDHRGGGNKRMSRRGRSMSIAFGSSVASRRNIDSKFAVSGMQTDLDLHVGMSQLSTADSPERTGLRTRLRQKAAGGLRRGSMSPARIRDWYGGGVGSIEDLRVLQGAEGSVVVPSLLDLVPDEKQSDVLRQLKDRESEFVSFEGLDVFCGTWNVNAKKPQRTDPLWLNEWLCPQNVEQELDTESTETITRQSNGSGCGEEGREESKRNVTDGMADVYAIGLQEVVDLNAVNVARDRNSQRMSAMWESSIALTLNLASLRTIHESPAPPGPSGNNRSADNDEGESSSRIPSPTDIDHDDTDSSTSEDDNSDAVGSSPNSFRASATSGTIGVAGPVKAVAVERGQRAGDEAGDGGANPRGGGQLEQLPFVLVAKEHLVGTWLAVFVRSNLFPRVSDVRTGTVTAGMLGLMGNKGGVGVRFRLRNSSMCFVSSHLAAHRENIRARNDNYFKILKGMLFPPLAATESRAKQQQQQQQSPGIPNRQQPSSSPPRFGSARRRRTNSSAASSPQSVSSYLSSLRSPSPPGSPSSLNTRGSRSFDKEVSPPPNPSWAAPPSPSGSARSPRRFQAYPEDVAPAPYLQPLVQIQVAGGELARGVVENTGERRKRMGAAGGATNSVGSLMAEPAGASASNSTATFAEQKKTTNPGVFDSTAPNVGYRKATILAKGDANQQGGEEREDIGESPTGSQTNGRLMLGNAMEDEDAPIIGSVFVDEPSELSALENGDTEVAAAAATIREDEAGGKPTQLLRTPEIDNQDTAGLGLQDHDAVFWLGDLNYRIDASVPAVDVLEHALADRLDFLRNKDQLNRARAAGEAFIDFQEGDISFLPTYKYVPGGDEYDVRPDKKFRAPAWCDRVLFWTGESCSVGGGITQLGYRRSETPLTSDHKPVSASFRFACKEIDAEHCTNVLMELIDQASRSSEGKQAKVDVIEGGTSFDFGVVRYRARQSRYVWMKNSGSLPAHFSMHSAPNHCNSQSGSPALSKNINAVSRERVEGQSNSPECEDERRRPGGEEGLNSNVDVGDGGAGPGDEAVEDVTAAWYVVDPSEGVLQPGEKLEVEFRVLVEESTARALAAGRISRNLEGMTVLRVEEGNDRYLSVRGIYPPSVYGGSLKAMLPALDASNEQEGERLPSQILEMANALLEDGDHCQQPGLFARDGLEQEVNAIREAIDTDAPLPPFTAHSMAEAMVTLLASLSPSVIPEHLCLVEDGRRRWHVGAKSFILLKKLRPPNRAAVVYLCSFFRSLLAQGDQNGLTPARVLPVLRACLLPDSLKRANDTSAGVAPFLLQLKTDMGDEAPRTTSGSANGGNDGGDDWGEGAKEGKGCDAMDLILHHLLVNESPRCTFNEAQCL